jgi:hypothetical protein
MRKGRNFFTKSSPGGKNFRRPAVPGNNSILVILQARALPGGRIVSPPQMSPLEPASRAECVGSLTIRSDVSSADNTLAGVCTLNRAAVVTMTAGGGSICRALAFCDKRG